MKRRLLLVAALLLGMLLLALAGLALPPEGVPVLNYHQVNDENDSYLTVPTADFAAQMDYLRDHGYTAVTPQALVGALQHGQPLPDKPVLITFDDGYRDNFACAYPILRERAMPALVFVISDYVGRFDHYLTWENVREMQAHGISFGSHTLSHESLPGVPAAELRHQLGDSKRALEWWSGQPAEFLAYPCGDYDAMTIEAAHECGYAAAFTIDLGYAAPGDDLYALHRIPIFGDMAEPLRHFAVRLRCPRLVAAIVFARRALVRHGLRPLAALLPYL